MDFRATRGATASSSAIRSHDNGWVEEDDVMTVSDDGIPVDFVAVPFEVKTRVWPRCVDRLGVDWPHVAALVAQHSLTIFKDHRGKPEWQASLRRHDRPPGCPAGTVQSACRGQARRRLSIRPHGGSDVARVLQRLARSARYGGHRVALTGNVLTVSPDPFGGAQVHLRIPARRVPFEDARLGC